MLPSMEQYEEERKRKKRRRKESSSEMRTGACGEGSEYLYLKVLLALWIGHIKNRRRTMIIHCQHGATAAAVYARRRNGSGGL